MRERVLFVSLQVLIASVWENRRKEQAQTTRCRSGGEKAKRPGCFLQQGRGKVCGQAGGIWLLKRSYMTVQLVSDKDGRRESAERADVEEQTFPRQGCEEHGEMERDRGRERNGKRFVPEHLNRKMPSHGKMRRTPTECACGDHDEGSGSWVPTR